jgi:hypothetical protein
VAGRRTEESLELSIPVRRLTRPLAALIVLFSLISLIGQVISEFVIVENEYVDRFTHWFDVNAEASIPTWYSAITLFAVSVMLGVIALAARRRGRPFVLQWTLLAIGFALLSLEEVIGVHSQATKVLRRAMDATDGPALLIGLGLLGVVVLAVAVALFGRWFMAMPRRWRILFAIGGLAYLAGVLGSDAVGDYLASSFGEGSLLYILVLTIEEALEMTGVLIFIVLLLEYIARSVGPVTVVARDGKDPSPTPA